MMQRLLPSLLPGLIPGVLAAVLVGCVTINIYFPEAAAQQAADRIIDEARGEDAVPAAGAMAPAPAGMLEFAVRAAHTVANTIIPAAHAQTNFDARSPAARALEQSLKKRFTAIRPYLDAGAVGLTSAGLLEIRDRNAVPLKERNALRQLVAEQNADWDALYKEIARINKHPDWIDQIRQVFAERWVAKARPGWYYRDAGGAWRQK